MTEPQKQPVTAEPNTSDIPQEVANRFLATLEEKGVSAAVVKRLRDALQSPKKITRQALTDALFNEEVLP